MVRRQGWDLGVVLISFPSRSRAGFCSVDRFRAGRGSSLVDCRCPGWSWEGVERFALGSWSASLFTAEAGPPPGVRLVLVRRGSASVLLQGWPCLWRLVHFVYTFVHLLTTILPTDSLSTYYITDHGLCMDSDNRLWTLAQTTDTLRYLSRRLLFGLCYGHTQIATLVRLQCSMYPPPLQRDQERSTKKRHHKGPREST